jgi:5-hydroxyisourate hydrolase-like protein (transthyretin family)
VTLRISNSEGKVIDTPINAKTVSSGTYELNYNLGNLPSGTYFAALYNKDQMVQYVQFVVSK